MKTLKLLINVIYNNAAGNIWQQLPELIIFIGYILHPNCLLFVFYSSLILDLTFIGFTIL